MFNYTYDPMEGYKLRIMELTDGGQFECRADDDHIHDVILKVNCELNNDIVIELRRISISQCLN